MMRNVRLTQTTITLAVILSVAVAMNTRGESGPRSGVTGSGLRNEAGRPPALFEAMPAPMARAPLRQQVVQSQAVLVRLDMLAATAPGEPLGLNLASSVWHVGVVDRVQRRSEARFTVAGRLEGTLHGTFVIVVEDGAAAGIIDDPANGLKSRLGYLADGVHVLEEIDETMYGRCGTGTLLAVPPLEPDADQTPVREAMTEDPLPDQTSADDCLPPLPVFDLMIVYTDVARQAIGGTAAMNAECQLAVEMANQAYDNSGIGARVRLVYRKEVSYNENGILENHLTRLAGTSDGFMDEVHALRNTYGADIVTLFVDDDDGEGWAGLAYCLPNTAVRAFNIVRWDAASGNFSFAHEIGHNQGCAHDRASAGSGCNAYSYSFGWNFMTSMGEYVRTVMAYEPGRRIGHFSNPTVVFEGYPTGVPHGDTDESDNAHTINLRRSIVEDHRTSRFDVWVDFSYGGTEVGDFPHPYDTVAEGAEHIVQGVIVSEQPTLWIKAGSMDEAVTIDRTMIIRSCGGSATIGY